VTSAVLVALLATVLAEESMGLSHWAAIRLVHWSAPHIYAADQERAADRAQEWEKRIKNAIPSHILALSFALSLSGWAVARIAKRRARAIAGAAGRGLGGAQQAGAEVPEGWSAMTSRRLAEVIMRWAARREYSDQPERAQTRAEEWVHDIRQAAEQGPVHGLATALPHLFSALRGPAHRRQRLVLDGDKLMVAFEEGEIGNDLLTDAVRALIGRARPARWGSTEPFEAVRSAAVDRLSAQRAAEFADVLMTAGMLGEAATVVQAWPVPELTADRSPDDLIPICRTLGERWPGGPGTLARLLSASVSHWTAGKRLQAEATIRRELDVGQ
jgi:hypothetical protein